MVIFIFSTPLLSPSNKAIRAYKKSRFSFLGIFFHQVIILPVTLLSRWPIRSFHVQIFSIRLADSAIHQVNYIQAIVLTFMDI